MAAKLLRVVDIPEDIEKMLRSSERHYNSWLHQNDSLDPVFRTRYWSYTRKTVCKIIEGLQKDIRIKVLGYHAKGRQRGATSKPSAFKLNLTKTWDQAQVDELYAHEVAHLNRFHHGTGWLRNHLWFRKKKKLKSVPYQTGFMFAVWAAGMRNIEHYVN